jgi:hypothetical protein
MEHRCGTRFAQNTRVLVERAEGVTAPAELCNVSASGALLRCALPVPLHAQVRVLFSAPNNSGWRTAERISAEVVRHSPTGFAVEWLEFSPQLVERFLSSPLRSLEEEAPSPLPSRR